MTNILTVDCEDWYHTRISRKYLIDNPGPLLEDRIFDNTSRLLEIFSSENARATFFVLGSVAESNPELISRIEREGHRVGSHGYSHALGFPLNRSEFENEVRKSTRILNNILSFPVESFRAPNWSIGRGSMWAVEILKDYGYKYDSSMVEFSGNSDYGGIIEFPRTHVKLFNLNVPFGGGGFLRLYPFWLSKYLLAKRNKNKIPFMVYLHPWEIDNNPPVLKTGLCDRIVQYGNIPGTIIKIKEILSKFKFCPVEEFIEKEDKNKRLLSKFYYYV